MQSVFVTTLLKSHPPPPLHAASMRVPHCNFFLSPIYWMSQAAHIYSLSKRPDNTLQLPTRRAISWCWLLSLFPLSMAVPCLSIPTFIYALYSLIRPKSVCLTSCNRIILISCLWRKSVSAFSSSMSHHRLYGRFFIGVCRYIRKRRQGKEVLPTLVSTWLAFRSYFYFGSETLSSPPLIVLEVLDWSVVTLSKNLCQERTVRFLPSTRLTVPRLPHFPVLDVCLCDFMCLLMLCYL